MYLAALISSLLAGLCTRAYWPLGEGLRSLRGKEEARGVHLGPRRQGRYCISDCQVGVVEGGRRGGSVIILSSEGSRISINRNACRPCLAYRAPGTVLNQISFNSLGNAFNIIPILLKGTRGVREVH